MRKILTVRQALKILPLAHAEHNNALSLTKAGQADARPARFLSWLMINRSS